MAKHVFLTGATGVLGAYLIKTFLEYDQVKLTCLVRAKTQQEGFERVKAVVASYDPAIAQSDKFKQNVEIVIGDISQENFGLPDQDYYSLCQNTDMVLHAAANTSLLASYDDLVGINLQGTAHIIDFALKTPTKCLGYCSSYSIFADKLFANEPSFTESQFYIGQSFDDMNYQKTKFESEKMVRQSQEKGLKWFIFRPGNIMGDSRTGKYPLAFSGVSSFYYDIFKTVIETGVAMQSKIHFDLTPVDYVAKAIRYWVMEYRTPYTVAHLTNPFTKRYHEWMEMLQQLGYAINLISPAEYVGLVREGKIHGKQGVYHSFTTAFVSAFSGLVASESSTAVDSTWTSSVLRSGDVVCPGINATIFQKYLNHFLE